MKNSTSVFVFRMAMHYAEKEDIMRKFLGFFLVITVLLSLTACPAPTPSNGTITVNITGAAANNGGRLIVVVADSGGTAVGISNPLTEGVIAGGSATVMARDLATAVTPIIATGGSNYRLMIVIDQDDDGTILESNVDYVHNSMLVPPGYVTITISGNTTYNTTGASFTIVP